MTKEAVEEVLEKLNEVGPSVAITFLVNPENYFEVISGLVDSFCHKNDLGCIYVAVSVAAKTLMSAFDSMEIDRKHVKFVDCISYATMQTVKETDDVTFVESPVSLENIFLRVEYLFRKGDDKKKLVIIDSANALSMHNDPRIISEFVQVLMSALRVKEAYPVILALGEQLRPEMKEMLGLVSDQMVVVGNKQRTDGP